MTDIEIKVFFERDWETYKFLRLTSLKDSPDSFGSTFEREAEFSEDEWKARINTTEGPIHALPLFVELKGKPVGLVWGLVHTLELNSGHIYQMWVSPDHRGLGIGRALLIRIISWAKELQLSSLLLAVTTSNTAAVTLYESFGFIPSGETESLREDSVLVTQTMILNLGANNKEI